MSHSKGRTAVIGVAIAAAVFAVAGGANAAGNPSIPDNSVTGDDVKTGSLYQSDINPAVVNVMRTPRIGSIWSSMLNANIVTEDKLSAGVRAKLNAVGAGEPGPQGPAGPQGPHGPKGDPGDPASDTKGALAASPSHIPTKIEKIGGPFAQNATEFDYGFGLPENATYVINTQGRVRPTERERAGLHRAADRDPAATRRALQS